MRPEHWRFTIPLRLRSLFRWAQADQELDDELRDHLERKTGEYTAQGMTQEEAHRRARLDMDGIEQTKEKCRDARRVNWIQDFIQDLRFAARMLRKSPSFTAVAVLTLALGIGANTAIFSVVDAVLLRPLPYQQPDRLVTISESERPNDISSRNEVAPGNFLDWRRQNNVFEQMGAVSLPGFNLTGSDRAERVVGAAVSARMLRMLGLRPAVGREFEASDDHEGAGPVVMLGYGLWQRRYGGDSDIVGKTIRLGMIPHMVIGVLPRGLTFPEEDVELWVPLEQTISAHDMHWRNSHYLDVYARLKPGVTLAQARTEMNEITAGLKRAYPDSNSGAGAYLVPMQEELVSEIRPALMILLAAVGFVLLITCANVSNLLLARATGREREMSIRFALGAGKARLVRQMVTESVLLSVGGGAMGLVVAAWASATLLALRPASLPRFNPVEINSRVLVFTLTVSVVIGVLFGIVPALRATGSDVSVALRAASRASTAGVGAQRLRQFFVACEIATSLILLIGAGLLIRSFARLRSEDLGFRTDHIVTARVSIPQEKYPTDAQVTAFYDQLVMRVRAIPGVEDVGATSFLPLTGRNFDNSFDIVARPQSGGLERTYALIRFVDPHYFKLMQIALLRGQGIKDGDRAGALRAIVISEAMAKAYWPRENPLGQRVIVYMGMDESPWEVVGIARDVRTTIAAQPEPTIYLPYAQFPYRYMVLAVLTHGDPKSMVEAIREATRTLDPDQPLSQVRTLEQLLAQTLVPRQFSMTLLGSFAALALALAAAGIYGVISYTVGLRTCEIGIRMALGARPGNVLMLILRQVVAASLPGIAVGLVGALLLTHFLSTQLYGIGPRDPLTFIVIPVLLAWVALAAGLIPARRATKVDPMVAFRYE